MRMLRSTFPAIAVIAVALSVIPARADAPAGMPWFMEVMPKAAQQAAWDEFQAIYGPDTAVPSKYKELIALAVSAQIPCEYCVYAHTKFAAAAGASDEEIGEALAVASQVRKWSTMLNGAQIDLERFKATIDGGQ